MPFTLDDVELESVRVNFLQGWRSVVENKEKKIFIYVGTKFIHFKAELNKYLV